jgi:hypothetical protein
MDIDLKKKLGLILKINSLYISCYSSCFGFDGYFFTLDFEFSNELLIF